MASEKLPRTCIHTAAGLNFSVPRTAQIIGAFQCTSKAQLAVAAATEHLLATVVAAVKSEAQSYLKADQTVKTLSAEMVAQTLRNNDALAKMFPNVFLAFQDHGVSPSDFYMMSHLPSEAETVEPDLKELRRQERAAKIQANREARKSKKNPIAVPKSKKKKAIKA